MVFKVCISNLHSNHLNPCSVCSRHCADISASANVCVSTPQIEGGVHTGRTFVTCVSFTETQNTTAAFFSIKLKGSAGRGRWTSSTVCQVHMKDPECWRTYLEQIQCWEKSVFRDWVERNANDVVLRGKVKDMDSKTQKYYSPYLYPSIIQIELQSLSLFHGD